MIKTISIEITADEADFNVFATELGYQDLVGKSQEELDLLTKPYSIPDTLKPNPVDKISYVREYLRKIVVDKISFEKLAAIQRQVDITKEQEKATLKSVIDSVVTTKLT